MNISKVLRYSTHC